jgi:single-strand DNA-binding protein
MANITIHGNIGRDPELRTAGSAQVLSFSVADKGFIPVKGGGQAPAQWYSVEVWGQQGERLYNTLTKGSEVVISGQLVQRPYTNKSGAEVMSLDVKASSVSFAGKKSEDSGDIFGGRRSTEEVPF